MPTKSDARLQAKLRDLGALRASPPDATAVALLTRALGDKVNLVVAKAAEVIGEWQITSLEPELVRAYQRLAVDGVRRDPSCAGKIAIVDTLRTMDLTDRSFWLAALRYRQLEPSYGPPIDTGAHVRATSALVIANGGDPDTLLELAPLLEDPVTEVRVGTIRAIGISGQPGSAALIWHKLLAGDVEPEPYYEGFVALLLLEPERSLPFVGGFLQHDRPGVPESAALALGESRRAEAFRYLQEAWETATDPAVRRSLLLGMALLRQEEASDYLLAIVADGPMPDVEAALVVLDMAQADERLWAKARAAFEGRSGR